MSTPTLETMLTEWRDLTARAQAAQAEADALFEHAGQCHGEVCVRLAELGWGAPRVAIVASEPVVTLDTPLDMTDWRNWHVGDIVECQETYVGQFTGGDKYTIKEINKSMVTVKFDDTGDTDNGMHPHCWTWVSRPSVQQ